MSRTADPEWDVRPTDYYVRQSQSNQPHWSLAGSIEQETCNGRFSPS
jgi:hypothetical protein